MFGSEEGSGLDPVRLDLDNLMSDETQPHETGNPGGERFAFRSRHDGTRENALLETNNKYAIIGHFNQFR